MDIQGHVSQQARKAREASRHLAVLSSEIKNNALKAMADALLSEERSLTAENQKDLENAKNQGLTPALIERLTLNPKRIHDMAEGLREVSALPDPVGEVVRMWRRPNGMEVGKMRVPIGVIGIIYESRPNVTADAASLCLKSGNAVVLRGGSEAIHSNRRIVELLIQAGVQEGLPPDSIGLIQTPDREAVLHLLKQDRFIDLIIPRGGGGLIQFVSEHSTIPVIKHDKGVCHTYIDEHANLEMAKQISFNAKVQRPATCNAMETLLVHEGVASDFLPPMISEFQKAGVEIRGCPKTQAIVAGIQPATEEDWGAEYLSNILAVKVVKDMESAIDHMDTYGSHHSEAIVTQDYSRAMAFLRRVDASAVFVNASTRLSDGYQFGLGAEIGISTTRIHARGPMGLEELTSLKFIVLGNGQLRE